MYQEMPKGSNCQGNKTITSEKICKAAADNLLVRYKESTTSTMAPAGCYWGTPYFKEVYFNTLLGAPLTNSKDVSTSTKYGGICFI